MTMDLTAVAAAIPTMNLGNAIGAKVAKLAMDQMEIAGDGMKKMMEMSVNPNLGANIDVSI